MQILSVVPRVYVSDVAAHLDFYKKLLDAEPKAAFQVRSFDIARFDQLVLIAGADPENLRVIATILVDSIEEAKEFVTQAGGEVLVGPASVPSGIMMIASHPDGNTFEYIEPPKRR